MDGRLELGVSFSKDTSDAPEGRLSGPGKVIWDAGALQLRGKTSRKAAAIILGIPGALVGLGIAVAAAMLLEEIDIDLMSARKGPVLVGMVALILAVGGYSVGAWIADFLMGKSVDWTIPGEEIRLVGVAENGLQITWTLAGVERKADFTVGKGQVEHMRALGRALKR